MDFSSLFSRYFIPLLPLANSEVTTINLQRKSKFKEKRIKCNSKNTLEKNTLTTGVKTCLQSHRTAGQYFSVGNTINIKTNTNLKLTYSLLQWESRLLGCNKN